MAIFNAGVCLRCRLFIALLCTPAIQRRDHHVYRNKQWGYLEKKADKSSPKWIFCEANMELLLNWLFSLKCHRLSRLALWLWAWVKRRLIFQTTDYFCLKLYEKWKTSKEKTWSRATDKLPFAVDVFFWKVIFKYTLRWEIKVFQIGHQPITWMCIFLS